VSRDTEYAEKREKRKREECTRFKAVG